MRLAPDRTVLDPLWGLATYSLALVWPDERAASGWARVVWPVDPVSRYPVAPVDLHVGHVLEVSAWRAGQWQAAYGWIADADDNRFFVVAPSVSAAEAVGMASRAFDVWRTVALADIEDAWHDRFERATRFGNRIL